MSNNKYALAEAFKIFLIATSEFAQRFMEREKEDTSEPGWYLIRIFGGLKITWKEE